MEPPHGANVSPAEAPASQAASGSSGALSAPARSGAPVEWDLRLQVAALESAANAILITDPAGTIRWVNSAFTRLTGYSPGEIVGQKPRVLKSAEHDAAFFKQMWETVQTGRVWRGELVNRRKDGSLYYEEMTITPVRDPEGEILGFVAVKADVTERHQAQEALARSRDELEGLVEQRTAKLRETIEELEGFSYSLSHDLRAPLRAMRSFAAVLQEECGTSLPPEGLDYLRRIQEASQRMDQLITDSLSYSKLLREALPLRPVHLGKLLRGILETYPTLQPPAAEVDLEMDALAVLGNESALTQCFSNLLDNAAKFVPPGAKPRIRIWAEPKPASGTDSPALVRIWVADNGIGIPPQMREKIFGMFQRMHPQSDYPGTGIGLTIVRKAVQRMGGRVGLESEPGKGSRFWVELKTVDSR